MHARFHQDSQKCAIVSTTLTDVPKIYARLDSKGRLLTVDKASNNLTVTSFLDGKVLKKYPGNLEEPYRKKIKRVSNLAGFDEFRPIRYSKEDTAPLWRRGLDSLVLLDPETLDVKAEYANFWSEGYVPMFLTIKSGKTQIFGYSMSSSDSLLTIMQINGAKTEQSFTKVPAEHKWAGMELSNDEKSLVVAKSCKR